MLDEDGDNKVSRAEFDTKKIAFLNAIDLNQDGYLTIDETLLSPKGFKQLDIDRDSRISSLEFVDGGNAMFQAADVNRDGHIVFEEFIKVIRNAGK